MNQPSAPSQRTRVRRSANYAAYDQASVHAIVDAAYICHIAFQDAHGAHCIPTACWRVDDHLYIHGSNGSRMVKQLLEQDSCVTITHLDGLVLARSAFNHTMNYRSVMIYGRFEIVEGEAKRSTMDVFMERLAPGRQHETRRGNDKEFAATTVLRIALSEAACKTRSGGPNDDEEDMGIQAWIGELPFKQVQAAPIPAADCPVTAPDYVRRWGGEIG
ncbi:pyridoxamine 5'-phosphate oxidase family protein [Massilia sp. MB5]|uniref:pyridoxamine 5'-phosphate oxidase family protein n=1 Tax=Massilia sp. MB5 TaxID=2919578 RepID=UPI001F0F74F8|nr:pyridoxamine 5'-phosphate oxidase family protein [Massilia sp. MB5]UMR32285.1 pyridoxamine 5'-phosphate oxidase family protein [Massilia sp. MB5]